VATQLVRIKKGGEGGKLSSSRLSSHKVNPHRESLALGTCTRQKMKGRQGILRQNFSKRRGEADDCDEIGEFSPEGGN